MLEIVKDYAIKKLDLLKLEATEKSVTTAGAVTVGVLAAFTGFFFFILLNIALGFIIGRALNSYGYGFLIMAGFYLLLMVLALVFSKNIKRTVANKLLKALN
ncbi:MAG: hypothetical protein EAS48_06585 [Chryseobacterium sp.]|nr:MAG: hypothetical protein EAS48_06585 [Chryseobacterium sp.]